jgi:hypothetical protein
VPVNLLLVILLIILLVRGGGEGSGPSRDRPVVEVPNALQLELAKRFRPILRFDSAEPWRPLNVDRFLDEAAAGPAQGQELCQRDIQGSERCHPVFGYREFDDTISHFRFAGENLYIDIAGRRPNGLDYQTPSRCPASPPLRDCNQGSGTAIYYDVVGANGRYYIDYWWFYRYNDFPRLGSAAACSGEIRILCSDHEGDWEGVTVVTPADEPNRVEYVDYAAHEGIFRYGAPQLDLGGPDRTHPVVYIAIGTHASYPSPCDASDCRQLARTVIRRPEGSHDGRAPWGRNRDDACARKPTCLIHLPPATADGRSWDAFAGLWGRICENPKAADCPVASGPRSPSTQDRYRAPWCAQTVAVNGQDFDKRETCDVVTPGTGAAAAPGLGTATDCRTWSGPSVAVLACDPDTLANALASDQVSNRNTITILVQGVNQGQTATPGVAQYIASPLRAPSQVLVRGRVDELTVHARQPKGRSKDLVEARFTGLGIQAGQEARIRIRYRQGRVRVALLLPSGRPVKPQLERIAG